MERQPVGKLGMLGKTNNYIVLICQLFDSRARLGPSFVSWDQAFIISI